MALVNEYTDGSPETTDATTIIYFTVTDDTLESFQPKIDICFKEVPIKECSEPSKPVHLPAQPHFIPLDMIVRPQLFIRAFVALNKYWN